MATCRYQATIRTGTLNVRSGPGVKFRVLGYLHRNERVTGPCRMMHGWTLIGRDYTYISGRGPSRPGWVHGRYIKRVR